MKSTVANLKLGQKGTIVDISNQQIPIKLFEMGCLPGNTVEMIQYAPFQDPLYININGSFIAIRKETALQIEIDILPETNSL